MSSTTGYVKNTTGVPLQFTAGGAQHGVTPTILISTLQAGASGNVFIANSDGAGVSGSVNATNVGLPNIGKFNLHYDNPVVGSNSGGASAPEGYTANCSVGSGTNNTNAYILGIG